MSHSPNIQKLAKVRLGDVCQFKSGNTLPDGEDFFNQKCGFLLLKVSDLNRDENIPVIRMSTLWTQSQIVESTSCKAGAIILPKRGGAIATNKKRILGRPAILDPNLMGVEPNINIIDSLYLYYWFQQFDLTQITSGSAVPQLNKQDLLPLQIPLPPLEEQHRIAAILDKADAIRRKRKEAIRLTEELLRSTFLDMFGDPVTNPKEWEVVELGKVASVNRGKFTPRPRNDPRYYNGIHPFIQTGDISAANGYLTKYHQTLNDLGANVSRSFRSGTVVIAIVGATIGETAILSKEMYCPDSVVGIKPHSGLCAEYLEYSLRWWKNIFRARAPETARANINLETIRPLLIPLPPLEMQLVFQQVYERIHAQKNHEQIFLYDNLFNSLLQRAFRGEL